MEQNIQVITHCKFDLVDRIKILFGRSVSVRVSIFIPQENEIPFFNASANIMLISDSEFLLHKSKPDYGFMDSPQSSEKLK